MPQPPPLETLPSPADTKGELSLVELMESLGPREQPADLDATLYYPIDERQVRAELVADPAPVPEAEAPSAVEAAPEPSRARRIADSLAQASLPKKAILVLLPCLLALVALTPVRQPQAELDSRAAAPAAPKPAPALERKPDPASAFPEPAQDPPRTPAPAVPRGTSVERAAADRVVSGDFAGALELYRELAETRGDAAPFAEAARILERRAKHAPSPQ